jgi:hypothetical protein
MPMSGCRLREWVSSCVSTGALSIRCQTADARSVDRIWLSGARCGRIVGHSAWAESNVNEIAGQYRQHAGTHAKRQFRTRTSRCMLGGVTLSKNLPDDIDAQRYRVRKIWDDERKHAASEADAEQRRARSRAESSALALRRQQERGVAFVADFFAWAKVLELPEINSYRSGLSRRTYCVIKVEQREEMLRLEPTGKFFTVSYWMATNCKVYSGERVGDERYCTPRPANAADFMNLVGLIRSIEDHYKIQFPRQDLLEVTSWELE